MAKLTWKMEEVEEEVSEKSLRNGGNHGFLVPAKAMSRTTGSLALEPMQKRSRAEAMGVYSSVAGKAKWKFRFRIFLLQPGALEGA
jgi:hypothetical protein